MTTRRCLLPIVLVTLVGCNGDSTTGPGPVATSIELSPSSVAFTALGETQQVTAVVRDQDGAAMPGAPLTWLSSFPDRASVSATGLVRAGATGSAVISARSGTAVGTVPVSVSQIPATIALSPLSLDLEGAGDTATVSATVSDAGGHPIADPTLTWSSSDEGVATVDVAGLVTAVSSGSATITGRISGETLTESVEAAVAGGVLTGSSGGQVSAANGAVKLEIPAAALAGPVFITAEPAQGLLSGASPIAGTVFELGPDGLTFDQPVTLTISYDPDALPPGVPEDELALHKVAGSSYEEVEGSSADPDANLVSGTIHGFSVYAVLRGLRVSTGSLPDAAVGAQYEAPPLSASGGAGDKAWSVVSGSLPSGLSLSTTGVLSGVPASAGTFTFTVQVESGAQRARGSLVLTVHDLPMAVTDLTILGRTSGTLTVQFTEVDDGSGMASDYAIRHAISPIEWQNASTSEVIVEGTQAGATREVTIDVPGGSKTSYDVQMVAFRGTPNVDPVFSGRLSNIATAPVLEPTGRCSESPGYAVVTFAKGLYPDLNHVDSSVRNGLGLGPDDPITCALAATLTEFYCCGVVILDLAGVQNLTGLESFTVTGGLRSGSQIRDLSPLAGLTNLTSLTFDDALRTGDLTPLAGLTGLSTLRLMHGGPVTDLSPISSLANLTTLILTHALDTSTNPDLGPLRGLNHLTYLGLSDNWSLKNIQPLLDNPGVGAGDTIILSGTSVSCADVAALEQKDAAVENNCLKVSSADPPSGVVDASYFHQLVASAGSGVISYVDWALAAESDPLPPGLTLSAAGMISGVPTTVGTWAFTVHVADRPPSSYSREARQLLTITIHPPPLNLTITAVHLNQGNQSLEGLVGGVADRPGILRVVARSDAPNVAAPEVRVRIFRDGALVREELLQSSGIGVPTEPDLDNTSHTWNLQLAASEIVPGLSVDALVDPSDVVPETDETDNAYPPGGGTFPLDVQWLPPLRVTFVPIESTLHGSIGNVNAENADDLLSAAWKWQPVSHFEVAIHAPLTSDHDLRTDVGWSSLLSDVQALRTLEGATDEYYHGILGPVSGSRWGGLAYVLISPDSRARSAVSLGSVSTSAAIVAHELGHNFGRRHAPCGGAAGPDPQYPYPNAWIGSAGYDIVEGTVKPSAMFDYMSYCKPDWTSDYTYAAILARRLADPLAAYAPLFAASRSATDGVLIWGRIGSAGVSLNPAVAAQARPALPASPGQNTLWGVAANGSELFRFTFDAESVADSDDPSERHFSFFVPLGPEAIEELVEITVATPLGSATVSSSAGPSRVGAPAAPQQLALDQLGPDLVQVRWDSARYPLAVIRDRTTDEVLSFARGGTAQVRADSPQDLVIAVSDGTRTLVLN